jgi:hypothetical protein
VEGYRERREIFEGSITPTALCSEGSESGIQGEEWGEHQEGDLCGSDEFRQLGEGERGREGA